MRKRLIPVLLSWLIASPGQAQTGEPYRVFFDWGKPELTRDAQATLDEAAAAYRPGQRVDVAGHTDRSGSAAYNLAASRRRAETVKSYLVSKGIPGAAVRIAAFGESRPIVPTEDGVREAQNRRVEIQFAGAAPAVATSTPLVRGDGSQAGSVSLIGNSLTIDARGLPPGPHGLHLHAIGRCEGPDFASAGAHWNPTGREHGRDNPQGPHLGDLPNLTIGGDGGGSVTLALPPGYLDADGAAVVIHASPDDNRTDPSGNSGARIACAAITR